MTFARSNARRRGRPETSDLTFETPEQVAKEGERIERAEYWKDVKDLAKQIVEEADDQDGDLDDILHETVDGSEYVIYYRHSLTVLRFTEHDDAWRDAGELGDEPVQSIAYHALEADIRAEIDRLPEPGDEVGEGE